MRSPFTALAVTLALLVASGCGAAGDRPEPTSAHGVLAATAARMGDIRSAEIDLSLVAATRGSAEGRVGFRLSGALALPEGEGLPVADLEYTQIAGANEGRARFLSTGDEAFVELDGSTYYALPEDQVARLQGIVGDGGPVAELDVGDWMVEPELEASDDTDVITGDLDVVAFYDGLRQLTGEALPRLDDAAEERLREAVSEASMEVAASADDHLLRRVAIHVVVGPMAPDDVPVLARGAVVDFELALDAVNAPVAVETPDAVELLPPG